VRSGGRGSKAVASVGSKGDSFRLCSGRGSELLVQGRADPQPGPLGGHRRRRGRQSVFNGLCKPLRWKD